MSVPHDQRAPHRQQRWIECHNVGSTTIPAYSVVEVVESIRPDTGRTVLNVRVPICDSPENTVILGHLDIEADGYGYCTNDFPTYVKYYGGTAPSPGEVWGAEAGNNEIVAEQDGFLILGDADTTRKIVRVRRSEQPIRLYKVKATTCHKPGDTSTMTLYYFDESSMSWKSTGNSVTVYDPEYKAMLLPGEYGWVAKFFGTECQTRYEFIAEQGLFRVAKADSTIACDSSGSATIYYHDSSGSCTPTASTCQVSVCNEWGFNRRIAASEEIHIRFLERKWIIIPTPRNQTIEAQLSAAMCPTDSSGSITGPYTYFDFCSSDTPTSADNDFSLAGGSGSKVLLKYDQSGQRWVIAQVQHASHTVLVDDLLRYAPTGCAIQGYELKYTALMSCDTPAWVDELSFTAVSVLQDVWISGLCFYGDVVTVYVPCVGTPSSVELFCGIDCDTGS